MQHVQWNAFMSLCIGILLIISVTTNAVSAATQGTVGQSYSTGSISITLHIPESTRLIARKSPQSGQQNTSYICLYVLDRVARTKLNHYRVALFDKQIDLQNEQALAHSIKESQLLQLRNYYGVDGDEIGECHSQHITVNRLDDNVVHPVLLMLIAE